MECSVEEVSKYIAERKSLDPYSLHAQISGYKYWYARQQIKRFFDDPSIEQVLYGTSSGDSRAHYLIRINDIIYVYHYSWGDLADAFYFTESELECYFEGFENEKPYFKDQF